jgi:hypothetical protein
MMGIRLPALVGLLCLLGPMSVAHGATGIVLGDSLGVDLAQVAHLKNFAQISVHIRGPKAVDQIRRAPTGTTAFVVLGTNDANGSIAHLEKSIDDVLNAAEKKGIKLVWIGPPCVQTSWDSRARELDRILAARLAPRGVQYVPMRDPAFCNGGFHARDGVHLKTKGTAYMWDKARRMAGFGGAPAGPIVATGSITEPPATRTGAAAAQAAPPSAPAAKFELAATPSANLGNPAAWAPKIYVLRVKRGDPAAQAN